MIWITEYQLDLAGPPATGTGAAHKLSLIFYFVFAIVSVVWYTMIMNIKQLIQLSPVPVEFVHEMDNPNFIGVYYQGKIKGYTGKACIEILDELDNCQKVAVLVHEIAHANCDVKNCKCMKNMDHTEREIHANKFVLSWLLKHKQKEALKREINGLTQQANGCTNYKYYIKAAKHVMGLKLWQKCLDYVK